MTVGFEEVLFILEFDGRVRMWPGSGAALDKKLGMSRV